MPTREEIAQAKEDKLNLEAVRKRKLEVIKERAEAEKNKPTEKEIKKTKEKKLKEAIDNLPGDEWKDYEITEELVKKRDLRRIFKLIAKNQPIMVSKVMEILNWNANKKPHAYEMFYLLLEMKLIEEIEVLKVWAKDYCMRELGFKAKLTEIEIKVLEKLDFWTKSMKEKSRNKFIGVSGYWILTKKGDERVCLLTETNTN